ncbi:DNA internalization-related competence protein ComEC/Rec2 [Escherichia coli]|uniref:DNA internalization-related competence protein ComEC/Rec2 n=1 Tax=Escherichia coli TaxID=562 RepID=UPI0005A776A9|nr:DNA internalization-related competence protein ComEC/Rec2 [Escherichia coli]EFK4589525.1 DNA internalization-related competence protein ComEC/Rec2 [Escherichia coli]EGD9335136.1 DNA internalization-related competence protein ComEC/Rec2 [Escherichia coli]EKG0996688.1 DNA internalization-related competence protein ComEC/Rec2 [Escherichia coli]HAI6149509.1 DNA internalization-related competence protein ComEC/Rec2 [Escherichia coli]HBM4898711.1 DNA internalization-related competence protein Com
MKITTVGVCIICGIFPLLILPQLPGTVTLAFLTLFACVLAFIPVKTVRYIVLTLLFFVWGILAAKQILWAGETLTGATQDAIVEIIATDGMTTHYGQITHLQGRRIFPAPGLVLYGEYLPQAVCAGQVWSMKLKVRAVHGQLNDGGFDSQRYAIAQHQPLTGRFLQASVIEPNCSLRAQYLASLQTTLQPYMWNAVILGLGMGERLSVSKEIKNIMRDTGTAHLMAISGLHIAFAALLAAGLIRGGQVFLPGCWIHWQMPLIGGICCAAFYAWLTGMQPPALRTVVALAIWGMLKLSGRQWSGWDVWICCLAAILLMDPVAILSQSLWLSAAAVAALIFWYQWFPCPEWQLPPVLRAVVSLIHLQLGITLLLMPVQIVIFHGISLTSFIANLFAIPLVTFITVPLILAAMVVHLSGPFILEQGLWFLADRSLALTLPAMCVAVGLLMCLPLWQKPRPDEWQVYMLDVGQGLAMVIARNGKAILYDTGLAWPEGDSGQQLIIPWLHWHNLEPEGVILSHEHLDHRGGLDSILHTWPMLWIRSPLNWEHHQPCVRGEAWQWQGLRFSAHWPLQGSNDKGNNHSCVVKIDDGTNSILLTGDIEAPAEQKMLSRYWQQMQATLLQVPHHGSNTSSSLPLIQRVNGKVALASASRYNAWRLPSSKVKHRYQQQGYKWLDTPHQGQITVNFSAQGWRISSLREQILPRWYHQWFGVPVDNG